ADSRAPHANLDVVDARFGLGNIFEPETSLGEALDEGFHSGFPPAKSAALARARINECRLFALRALRPCRNWRPGLLRSASWRTVGGPGFPVGFLHFGYGVGKKTEHVAEAAPHALPPVLA